jgi:ribonuclease P protein component
MHQPGGSASFGPERRLRRKADFQRVFDSGRRVHGRFFTMLAVPNKAGTARLGVVASRKLGDAVHRNRAKRLIREAFRRTVPASNGPAIDLVVIPRRELFGAPYGTLENDFRTVLRRCAGTLPRRESH